MASSKQGFTLMPDEDEELWFLRTLPHVQSAQGGLSSSYAMRIQILPPDSEAQSAVSQQDEVVYILEGTGAFHCGKQCWNGQAGTFFFLPRDVPHTYGTDSNQPLKLLVITTSEQILNEGTTRYAL